MSNAVTVKVELPITNKNIYYLFVSSFEGGMTNAWVHNVDLVEGTFNDTEKVVWWGHEDLFESPYKMKFTYENPDGDGPEELDKVITQDDVQRGMQIFAEKYPRHFGDFMNEGGDAITADVFMQCVVLGDVYYG